MFNTKYNDLRYTTSSIIHENNKTDILQAIIDTGARRTVFVASGMKENKMKEEYFQAKPYLEIGGFIRNDKNNQIVGCKIYQYTVTQFTVGNIDLKQQTIWVTFDNRVTDNVLGLDILRQVGFIQYPNSNMLSIFESKDEMNDYIKRNSTLQYLV